MAIEIFSHYNFNQLTSHSKSMFMQLAQVGGFNELADSHIQQFTDELVRLDDKERDEAAFIAQSRELRQAIFLWRSLKDAVNEVAKSTKEMI